MKVHILLSLLSTFSVPCLNPRTREPLYPSVRVLSTILTYFPFVCLSCPFPLVIGHTLLRLLMLVVCYCHQVLGTKCETPGTAASARLSAEGVELGPRRRARSVRKIPSASGSALSPVSPALRTDGPAGPKDEVFSRPPCHTWLPNWGDASGVLSGRGPSPQGHLVCRRLRGSQRSQALMEASSPRVQPRNSAEVPWANLTERLGVLVPPFPGRRRSACGCPVSLCPAAVPGDQTPLRTGGRPGGAARETPSRSPPSGLLVHSMLFVSTVLRGKNVFCCSQQRSPRHPESLGSALGESFRPNLCGGGSAYFSRTFRPLQRQVGIYVTSVVRTSHPCATSSNTMTSSEFALPSRTRGPAMSHDAEAFKAGHFPVALWPWRSGSVTFSAWDACVRRLLSGHRACWVESCRS